MWHKPCRTFHPWCLCIKTRCLSALVVTPKPDVTACILTYTDNGVTPRRINSCVSLWRINSLGPGNATYRHGPQHDDVIKWKHFPRYWPFVWRIHRSPVNSLHKGQWRGALMFSLICARINGRVNNGEASDLRRYRAHYHQWRGLFHRNCERYHSLQNVWKLDILKHCYLSGANGLMISVVNGLNDDQVPRLHMAWRGLDDLRIPLRYKDSLILKVCDEYVP